MLSVDSTDVNNTSHLNEFLQRKSEAKICTSRKSLNWNSMNRTCLFFAVNVRSTDLGFECIELKLIDVYNRNLGI